MIKDVKIPIETTELINQISDNARGKLFTAIMVYASTGLIPTFEIAEFEKGKYEALKDFFLDMIRRQKKKALELSDTRKEARLQRKDLKQKK